MQASAQTLDLTATTAGFQWADTHSRASTDAPMRTRSISSSDRIRSERLAASASRCRWQEGPTSLASGRSEYRIGELLGFGGMGFVYRARDVGSGEDVAVKVLSPALSSDAGLRRRLEREFRIGASIRHRNVVSFLDYGTNGGTPFLVMELIEGSTLHHALAGGRLSGRTLVEAAHRLASGLAAIHRAGFVHRDIKPTNVMRTPRGEVKIVDLGLAAPAGGSERDHPSVADATVPGAVMGTVKYMSPEQARGERLDPASDQFSLGVVLYEAVSGRNPFSRASLTATISAILHEEVAPPGADHDLNAIIQRCLQKRPGDRFPSTEDLIETVSPLVPPPNMEAARASD